MNTSDQETLMRDLQAYEDLRCCFVKVFDGLGDEYLHIRRAFEASLTEAIIGHLLALSEEFYKRDNPEFTQLRAVRRSQEKIIQYRAYVAAGFTEAQALSLIGGGEPEEEPEMEEVDSPDAEGDSPPPIDRTLYKPPEYTIVVQPEDYDEDE